MKKIEPVCLDDCLRVSRIMGKVIGIGDHNLATAYFENLIETSILGGQEPVSPNVDVMGLIYSMLVVDPQYNPAVQSTKTQTADAHTDDVKGKNTNE